jgi:hypothetical protein
MPPQVLLQEIQRRPFVPFRIHLTDGTVYEVRHPELIIVGAGFAVVGLPADPNLPVAGRTETLALVHVVRLEPIPQQPATSSN